MNGRHARVRIACVVPLVSAIWGSASADWPHSSGINLPLSTAANAQNLPTSVSDGAGGAIVAWTDYRDGASNADIYVQRVLASGQVDAAWPVNGRALCTAANNQSNPSIVSDGAGGAIVAWHDYRSGSTADIYAQHVLASGAVDGNWPVDGRGLCTFIADQLYPMIASDGLGGAIVTWQDRRGTYDIYAQHVLASGAVDGAWPVNGQALCTAGNVQDPPVIVSDGAGGAIAAWGDFRNGVANDIYAQHVLASGAVDGAWPLDGRALCTAVATQSSPAIVSDGAGGALVAWVDYRSGASNTDIYAGHVRASGAVDGSWPVDGRAMCSQIANQSSPAIVTDDAGGAIVTWVDYRSGASNPNIYAAHVLALGALDGTWPVAGRALTNGAFYELSPAIVSDGAGGAIVAWQDVRPGVGFYDLYAQHVLVSGVVDGAWPVDGRALCISANNQDLPTIVSDGAGGAIVAWQDWRNVGPPDIYAQRVARSGYLGNPEPHLASVRDVPNDQGGRVKLSWTASYLDAESPYVVDHYWIFRSAPPNIAARALARGARLLGMGDRTPITGESVWLSTVSASTTYYWEYIGSQPAAHFTSTYSYVAETTSDSIGASNPKTAFIVVAYDAGNTVNFPSNPDSGYSADNLAPNTPSGFTAEFLDGAAHLHWNPNSDSDLANYRLYRGTSESFVPGPANLIATPPGTVYVDSAPGGGYYKLSAIDAHGNESGFATGTAINVGVSDAALPAVLFLARPTPNPAPGEAMVRFGLPREAHVRLAIHDVGGRRIRELARGVLPAGEHARRWDGLDANGQSVAGGLYLVRLEADGRVLHQKLIKAR